MGGFPTKNLASAGSRCALMLDAGRWVILGVFRDEAQVRVEPFEAIELELGVLWAHLKAE